MKRTRLKHCAHILCHMFCGWRLHSDWDALVRYGTGELKIDVLGEECSHNDNPISLLTIARELKAWLVEDLRDHHISLNELKEAKLEVEVELGLPKPSPSGPEVPCSFHCRSQISTDEKDYTWTYDDQQFLIVSPDVLRLNEKERDELIQECFRMAERLKVS